MLDGYPMQMITAAEQCRTMGDVAEFERYLDAMYSKRRIVKTLSEWEPLEEYNPYCVEWRGLVRVEFGRAWQCKPRTPRGYAGVKLWDRNAIAVMPLWLYPFYRLRREWQRFLFEPLMRFGAWVVPIEGDFYVNGHWAWHQPFASR